MRATAHRWFSLASWGRVAQQWARRRRTLARHYKVVAGRRRAKIIFTGIEPSGAGWRLPKQEPKGGLKRARPPRIGVIVHHGPSPFRVRRTDQALAGAKCAAPGPAKSQAWWRLEAVTARRERRSPASLRAVPTRRKSQRLARATLIRTGAHGGRRRTARIRNSRWLGRTPGRRTDRTCRRQRVDDWSTCSSHPPVSSRRRSSSVTRLHTQPSGGSWHAELGRVTSSFRAERTGSATPVNPGDWKRQESERSVTGRAA